MATGRGIPNNFAPPLHHEPIGPTDFTTVKLPSPFTVLIIGGSKGIGLGTAKAFATAGASEIILTARSESDLESAAEAVRETNPSVNVATYACDVREESQVKSLTEKVSSQFQRLDVLVISAGTSATLVRREPTGLKDFPASFVEQSYADFQRIMALNVSAPFLLLRYFTPLLEASAATAKAGAPAVIQLNSAAAWYMDPKVMAMSYSLSKLAVTRLIEHFHAAHHEKGINAFSIQPGGVKTDLSSVSMPEGKGWYELLVDDVQLCGGMCVWLTKEKRDWLSGRYIDARWDIDELLRRKQDIIDEDLLKVRLAM